MVGRLKTIFIVDRSEPSDATCEASAEPRMRRLASKSHYVARSRSERYSTVDRSKERTLDACVSFPACHHSRLGSPGAPQKNALGRLLCVVSRGEPDGT